MKTPQPGHTKRAASSSRPSLNPKIPAADFFFNLFVRLGFSVSRPSATWQIMLDVFHESFKSELFEKLINGQFLLTHFFTVDLCGGIKKLAEKRRSRGQIAISI
jgi:hypothetical protein